MRGSDENPMLSAAIPLIEAGIAVHWLHRNSKAPVGDDWQNAPVHTLESLRETYRRGYNIGVRPGEFSKTAFGYLHLIDVDIRDAGQAAEAWAIVLALWPDAREAPFVLSGSGGESRHLYFFTDRPFRSKKLGHSEGFSLVYDAKKERNVKKYDWEVELFGAPKQAVLPPSIHPDTGKPYVWGREIDFMWLEFGVGPIISSDQVEAWGARAGDSVADEDDEYMSILRAAPMGLTEEDIDRTLRDLPIEWLMDRDCWYQTGMALHHEYEGSAEGFDKWTAWSKQAPDKFDAKDQAVVWKSFKGRDNPVRMATLIQAAGMERDRREMDWMGDFDTFDGPAAVSPGNTLASLGDDLDALLGRSTALTVIPAADSLDDIFGRDDPAQAAPIDDTGCALEPADPEWQTYYDRNEDGDVKPTSHNVELIIRHDPRLRGCLAFNEFSQETVLIRQPKVSGSKRRVGAQKPLRELDAAIWKPEDTINGTLWSDSHDNNLRVLIETPKSQGGYQLKTSDRDLRTAVDLVAQKRRFHPIRNYLNSLKWDGHHRVERLFCDYVGSPDDAYHREAALLFMLGAVTRVFEPGHKFDFVPILEGLQGKRKSTFIRILGCHWFSELEGDFHDKKSMVEAMQGSWILEIPELQGFSKAEVTTIKGFVSRQVDKVRLSYDKRARSFARQCVFMGSTNDREYLRDQTGGRRFWPIICTVVEIDTDRLQDEVDQLWAEAVFLYREWRQRNPNGGLPLYMRNQVAAAEASRLQESRRQERAEDVLAGQIQDWLDLPIETGDLDDETRTYRNEVVLLEVWCEMMGEQRYRYPDKDQQLLGRAMRQVEGWHLAGQARHPKYGKQRLFKRNESI